MSEDAPQIPERETEDNRWRDAISNAEEVIHRQYPDAPADKQAELAQYAKDRLAALAASPALKFVETVVDDQSHKTLEPTTSETSGEGLPIGEVIELLGYGDGHEFESGVPSPDKNPRYLQTVSNLTGKPLEAWLPDHKIIHISPETN